MPPRTSTDCEASPKRSEVESGQGESPLGWFLAKQ
jgi:hypothetical protein